jgi:hypothetical protein
MNDKNEILAIPGVQVLRIKKDVPVENETDDRLTEIALGSSTERPVSFRGSRFQIRRASFAFLTLNLLFIVVVLVGFSIFMRDATPTASMRGYTFTLKVSIIRLSQSSRGLECILNVSASANREKDITEMSVRFHNASSQDVVSGKLPTGRGETHAFEGTLVSYSEGEPVYAEIRLDHDKLKLKAVPASN